MRKPPPARQPAARRRVTACDSRYRQQRLRPDQQGHDDAGERGSITVFMVTLAVMMVLLVGVAVDLGGQVWAKQRVQDVAGQAARVGGQQLQSGAAIRGQGAVADPARAVAAARAYLAGDPTVRGTAAATGPNTITVNTTSTYRTKFLGIIGVTSLTVTGRSQVRIVRANAGVAR